jgi:hypothetical protein
VSHDEDVFARRRLMRLTDKERARLLAVLEALTTLERGASEAKGRVMTRAWTAMTDSDIAKQARLQLLASRRGLAVRKS